MCSAKHTTGLAEGLHGLAPGAARGGLPHAAVHRRPRRRRRGARRRGRAPAPAQPEPAEGLAPRREAQGSRLRWPPGAYGGRTNGGTWSRRRRRQHNSARSGHGALLLLQLLLRQAAAAACSSGINISGISISGSSSNEAAAATKGGRTSNAAGATQPTKQHRNAATQRGAQAAAAAVFGGRVGSLDHAPRAQRTHALPNPIPKHTHTTNNAHNNDNQPQGGTCGFGTRGQKARSGSGTRPGFEGGQMPLYRRLPKLRGIAGGMSAGLPKYVVVNLEDLEKSFEAGAEVDVAAVAAKGLLNVSGRDKKLGLKVLGEGSVSKALNIKAAAFSAAAAEKIAAAGGSAVVAEGKAKWTRRAHEKRVKEMVAAGLDPKKEAAKAKAARAAAKAK